MSKPIPSPPGLPFLGNLLDFAFDDVPTNALDRLADQYGPIYKIIVNGRERIIVADCELFEELCDETRFFKAVSPSLAAGKGGPAQGLFTSPSERDPDWGQAHRILMPAFGPMAIRDMFDEMHDIASQLVLKWARKGADYRIPVTEDFTRLTLDTIALCAMDFRFNSFYQDEMHPFVAAMTNVLSGRAQQSRLPGIIQKFMYSANEKIKQSAEYQRQVAGELVQHRRDNPTDKKDLLNAMINGKDPRTGEGMRDELIAANMVTFLVAGHETTSGLLSFAFLQLLKHPETYFKAQQEVDRVVGRSKITADHLKDLKYINAVLRETLRLTPTAPAVTRTTREENKEDPPTLGNGQYELKRDWNILCLLTKIQKDPKVYGDDANQFRPERMLDEEFNKLPKSAWKPFGTGMRACIGRAFAWQEALLVTALLLQNFNFRLDDPNYEMQIKSTLTIKPKDFFMHASLRSGVSATTLQHSLAAPSQELSKTEKLPVGEGALPSQSNGKSITVLYGSNTGTCQSFAQKVASDAQRYGYVAKVADLDTGVDALPQGQPLLVITASYEGQPPDNAAQFVAWLQTLQDPKCLEGIKFAVFGCGHKDWRETYHRIPKLVDDTLEKLGGARYVERGSSDAAQGDMFSDFDTWADSHFWPAVTKEFGKDADATPERTPQVEMEISTKMRGAQLQQDVQQGTVTGAEVLTAPNVPEKRSLEIKLPEGMEYEAGDYLTVLPLNPAENVRRALARFGLPWDAVVNIKSGGPVNLPANQPVSAFDLLQGFVELSLPATKKNIQACIESTTDADIKAKLTELSSSQYQDEVLSKRTSLLDILEKFPNIPLPFAEFLAMLPPMRPRHYSISSSPLVDHTKCTITYGVINTVALSGQGRFVGVTGSYLSSLRPGDAIQVSVRRSTAAFHLPASPTTTPIVMFCNGTGLAPFRSFIEERAVQIASNPQQKLAPALLFVGCRSKTADRLYADNLAEWAKAGAVDVRYAFSREADDAMAAGCRYVQDRMLKDKEDIYELWEQGANIYLCGSPDMVEGVRKAARVMVDERKKAQGIEATPEQVDKWFAGMRNQRIAVDVFA